MFILYGLVIHLSEVVAHVYIHNTTTNPGILVNVVGVPECIPRVLRCTVLLLGRAYYTRCTCGVYTFPTCIY